MAAQEKTGSILVVRVLFDDLAGACRFLDFRIGDASLAHPLNSMAGKPLTAIANFLLDELQFRIWAQFELLYSINRSEIPEP